MKSRFRHDVRFCAPLRIFVDGDDTHAYVTKNVSVSGIYLLTETPWPMGTELSLRIVHRFGDLLAKGKVMHSQKDGVGIRFEAPSEDLVNGLVFIIDELLARRGEYEDRRRGLRWHVDHLIVFSDNAVQAEAEVSNLSRRGAFLATSEQRPAGSKLWVYFPVVDAQDPPQQLDEARGCQALVTHQAPEGFGIEFNEPSGEFLEAVEALLAADIKGVS